MIRENLKKILEQLPDGVQLVGAVKTRTTEEIIEAIDAGLKIIGQNYVQEAEKIFQAIGTRTKHHLIGHLQSNKAKKAVNIFDMIETVDSEKLARAINNACQSIGKVMPVLLEINSGEEPQKAGIMPADFFSLIEQISEYENISIQGLMTMGPFSGNPEDARPYFQKTRQLFEQAKRLNIRNIRMEYLSMGMSNSFKVAIEESANLVRIGTAIFGERDYD
ncbi:MAG TPA: YggS family pyridoxal phosphate-dependent enzyme [Desulfobacteraceae bacterium]|nr:YggS family pyridoxal phosphate-dependent enzyme [Desulfobacteraceae bacterium]HPJ68658.1 YggS family pyridoxal phosphate-dependent enzyme [Desulfobacteraceae bacterium]HPQ29488.1 YggS family pyridoxal phosphate-dependent enzyme [Desulfobacteraceae bacterium]